MRIIIQNLKVECTEIIYCKTLELPRTIDVCEKLKRLKEDKACGPDGIHPKLLKECAEIIAIPLYQIFSRSLESGVVPADWKLANVSPIHKKGSRAVANNNRPVSLTCLTG